MKKLEIIIQPEKLEALKTILDASNVSGIMISNIMGYGNQKGHKQFYRGAEYSVNLLPKIKVETVVEPEVAEPLIRKIVEEIKTGAYGDGKIFVYEVQDAVRIRKPPNVKLSYHHTVVRPTRMRKSLNKKSDRERSPFNVFISIRQRLIAFHKKVVECSFCKQIEHLLDSPKPTARLTTRF